MAIVRDQAGVRRAASERLNTSRAIWLQIFRSSTTRESIRRARYMIVLLGTRPVIPWNVFFSIGT
jgi:hypothetical protein